MAGGEESPSDAGGDSSTHTCRESSSQELGSPIAALDVGRRGQRVSVSSFLAERRRSSCSIRKSSSSRGSNHRSSYRIMMYTQIHRLKSTRVHLALLVLPTIGYVLIMMSHLPHVEFIATTTASSSSARMGSTTTDILVLLSRGTDGSSYAPGHDARGLSTPTTTNMFWTTTYNQQQQVPQREMPSDQRQRMMMMVMMMTTESDAVTTMSETDYQLGKHLLTPMTSSRRFRPNYGYLVMDALNASTFVRTIHRDDDKHYHMGRYQQLRKMDRTTDSRDFSKSDPDRYTPYDDIEYPKPSGCYRPHWTYEVHPNCNGFHEQTLELPVESTGLDPTYLGRGYFRMTWLLEDHRQHLWQGHPEEYVLKLLKMNDQRDFRHHTYFSIQLEGLLMDRTAGSLRTSDIYGYCGTSTVVQRGLSISRSVLPSYDFYHSVDAPPVQPANPAVSVEQKLKLAIQMAEGLAEMHGDPQGVIVNDDIQIQQWLLDRSGNLKLNDMNNGKILQWNPDKGEYCTFKATFDYLWRAPEETNRDDPADESADVYALGQIYYTLLTGLVPFYEHGDWTEAIAANRKGQLPHIADRYQNENATVIERGLVAVMRKIWQYDRKDRPSIFEVLRDLYETARLYERENPDKPKIADVPLLDLVTTPY